MSIEQAIEIGTLNAEAAIDQQHEYSSLANAIDSHFWNVQDTLMEEGILTDENFDAAIRAFNERIAKLTK